MKQINATGIILYPQFSEYEICAPYFLAKAGILIGKKYTVGLTQEQRDFLGVFEEENYSMNGVVRDGDVITSRGRYFIDFAFAIGDALGLKYDKAWYNR